MTTRNTTSPTKRLTDIRQKMMALRQEESKIQHDLSGELSKILVDVQALEIDFDVLIGGILEVIAQSKIDTDKTETWRESGQKFLKSRSRRGQEKECVQEESR